MHCTVACSLADGQARVQGWRLFDRGYVILVRVTALHCTALRAQPVGCLQASSSRGEKNGKMLYLPRQASRGGHLFFFVPYLIFKVAILFAEIMKCILLRQVR